VTTNNSYFNKKRNDQNKFWLIQTIENQIKTDFFNQPKIKKELQKQLELIELNKTTPFAAAELLLKLKE
jgi:LAO/AO transport system kinase